MLQRVLRDIYASPPDGCRTDRARRLLDDFFTPKPFGSLKKYWVKYRWFAQFLKLQRGAWAGAVEELLGMGEQQAKARIMAFRAWLKEEKKSCSGVHGSDGPGMFTLLRFARERKVIAWKYPHAGEIRHEEAWSKVPDDFRSIAEEWRRTLFHKDQDPQLISAKMCNVRTFGEWLKNHRINFRQVDYSIACDWMDWLVGQAQWSQAYKKGKFDCIKGFYSWLRRRRLVLENPFDSIGPIRVPQLLPVWLLEGEVLKLLKAATDPRESALAEFLYATGCRLREMCGANLADLNLIGRTIKVFGKHKRERIVMFNKATVTALKAYLPIREAVLKRTHRVNEPALFVTFMGFRIGGHTVQASLAKMAGRAGITKHITPHTLRHSYATHLLNRGADIYSLMNLMGHKSIQATVRYLRVATDRLAAVYRKCFPRK